MQHKNQETLAAIEAFISEYIDLNGVSPSITEIVEGTGTAKSTASRYLSYMREQGIISFSGQHRSYATKEMQKTRNGTMRVPVLGRVSCGIPKFAEENIEEYVRLPIALFGQGDFFILRANGESMIEAGIEDGDLVLVRHQSTADAGQIVVALMDDEATLKRYYPEPEKRQIRLHPENRTMQDIIVDDCIIQGVAVKVLKDLT